MARSPAITFEPRHTQQGEATVITIILALTFLSAVGLCALLAQAIRIARRAASPKPALAAHAAASD
jgi:hypothetical protein